MKEEKKERRGALDYVFVMQRVVIILAIVAAFFPAFSPSRVTKLIDGTISLFTSGVSYSSLTDGASRALRMGWVDESVFVIVFIGSLLLIVGIALATAGGCMSLGNLKLQRFGLLFSLAGSVVQIVGIVLCYVSYNMVQNSENIRRVKPVFPSGMVLYIVFAVLLLITTLVLMLGLPKADKADKYEMESKYKLFLMFLPFAALAFVFCYLPLWGWRYAFFDYKAGGTLSMSNFVGFKWFTYLFKNAATRRDLLNVMKNTLGLSALNVLTSWVPMMFAVFLCEIKSLRFRRFVQTFTTIPNFISWVLVYAIAIAIFSTDGFLSSILVNLGIWSEGHNLLMNGSHTWLKMWLWGTWKGIGWSAIIYIAGISGIDQQLYEAATVDGAGRFQRMWHITVPGLIPTFCVLLLMSIANVLSNGMDQYLVFKNATNATSIRVLDLYVYELGIGQGSIPLTTVVSMLKSVISVTLLFLANSASKLIRGESIV